MNRPDKIWNKLSVAEKEVGGIPNSSEDIKQAVQQVFEKVWNQGDTSAADQIFADTYVAHIANISSPINSADEFKQFVALFRALSPDMCFTIDDQVAEGDKVATRWSARLQTITAYTLF